MRYIKTISLMLGLVINFSCVNSVKNTTHDTTKNTITFIVEVPEDTPIHTSLYISGTFDNWSGGKALYKLQKTGNKHIINLQVEDNEIQFKFTLGSWDTVERDKDGKDIKNRVYKFNNTDTVIQYSVASWTAKTDYGKIILPENVSILTDAIQIPQFSRTRRIWVYTPPNYKNSTNNYPVLYMHDAQNLFMDSTSYAGEWQVDEVLNNLPTENGLELIVVGIDHGEEFRNSELTPWTNENIKTAEGEEYLDFIVNTLKPKIDLEFRTKPDKANTAIIGASLGGLISHYAGFKYSHVFGKVGAFSPSYWVSDAVFTHSATHSKNHDGRLYILIGTEEGEDMLEDAQKMKTVLLQNQFKKHNLLLKEVQAGEHNETLWRTYFPEAISWLFEKQIPKKQPFDGYISAKPLAANLASGTLMRIDAFPSKFIKPRPIDVWLPNNYADDKTYKVLYMHDGQMLFDANTTWNKQEWNVDEWASQLMAEDKTEDFIVVGIHNIPDMRWQDLFPQKTINYLDEKDKVHLKSISGQTDFQLNGDNYLKFLVYELKPYIDNVFSTKSQREHTFVMGSSMGGLMSMYAVSEYPDIFAGAACLSTHWVGAKPLENNPLPDAIFKYVEAHLPNAGRHKIYFDYGNKTLDAHYPQYAPRLNSILKQKGYTDTDSRNLFFEGTNHSENAWNKRLDKPLRFLLSQ